MSQTIINGDSAEILKQFASNTIDAVVTDPPYGIEFLGKDWDRNTGATEIWQECLRILKPGGHLLAFSAARTYHILATNIQQTGFEIRDQLMWLYSSGFPKAQQIKGHKGWKTALKPAHEPIVMARKSFPGSTYMNMDKWGVGALDIDATRVAYEDAGKINPCIPRAGKRTASFSFGNKETKSGGDGSPEFVANDKGRFPSNVIGEVPGYQKFFYCPKVTRRERHTGFEPMPAALFGQHQGAYDDRGQRYAVELDRRTGVVGNNHPTVKPVALMKYLVRLVTPQQAHILDPFAGSGSTGMACRELGRRFTGIELDPDYCEIARRRIEATPTDPKEQLFE